MKSTHCIFYCFDDVSYRNPTETSGRCLDYTDANGYWLPCAMAIEKGQCHRKRTTPLGAKP